MGVACASPLILSCWVGTGAGSDSPHFERLLFAAWRRVPHRRFTVVFDAGYHAEHNHDLAIAAFPQLLGAEAGEQLWQGEVVAGETAGVRPRRREAREDGREEFFD